MAVEKIPNGEFAGDPGAASIFDTFEVVERNFEYLEQRVDFTERQIVQPGPQGEPGGEGLPGRAGTISIAEVVSLAPTSQAFVENIGDEVDAVLRIGLPRGLQGLQGVQGNRGLPGQQGTPGQTPSVLVGNVTTLPAGEPAAITNTGTGINAVLDFAIPMGQTGEGGGDVLGPGSSIDSHVVLFDGTTGRRLKTGGILAPVATAGTFASLTGKPATLGGYGINNAYSKTEIDGFLAGYASDAELQSHLSDNGNPHSVTKSQVGLANVDNTSDANKPISIATQAALNGKAAESALQAHASDTNNPHSVSKAQVGLGNVDNSSDADKPVSTAQQAALDLKAPLADPVFTGVPRTPTVDASSNSTAIASTAFVIGRVQTRLQKSGDTLTGALSTTPVNKGSLTGGTTTFTYTQGNIQTATLTSGANTIATSNIPNDGGDLEIHLLYQAGTLAFSQTINWMIGQTVKSTVLGDTGLVLTAGVRYDVVIWSMGGTLYGVIG